jgi:hypothetical protein
MIKHYKYDIIGAYYSGVHEHPQKQMKNLGYNVVKAEPVPIADCWWFRVDNEIENVPDYLILMRNDFKFSNER